MQRVRPVQSCNSGRQTSSEKGLQWLKPLSAKLVVMMGTFLLRLVKDVIGLRVLKWVWNFCSINCKA